MRGLDNVQGEWTLHAFGHNVRNSAPAGSTGSRPRRSVRPQATTQAAGWTAPNRQR